MSWGWSQYAAPIAANRPTLVLRDFKRRFVLALAMASIVTIAGVVGANVVIDSQLAGIQRVNLDVSELENARAEAGNYLIIGSDTRSGVTTAEDEERFGDRESQAGQRSDTMMVVHVDPEVDEVRVVSIPRDLLVEVEGHGRTRINTAYNDADTIEQGAQNIIDTLDRNLGLKINHFVEVNFWSFREIVDAIGTVNVYFDRPIGDDETGLRITETGCVALDGDDAFNYVRSRFPYYLETSTPGNLDYVGGNSDLERIVVQQDFVRRLATVAFRQAAKNPLTAKRVADAVVPKLVADEGFGRAEFFGLANLLGVIDPSDPDRVETLTLPIEATAGDNEIVALEPDASILVAELNHFGPDEPRPDVDPKTVTVNVMNGSTVSGLAADTLGLLESRFGFVAGDAGDWLEQVTATEVRYAKGGRDAAIVVAAELGLSAKPIADSEVADGGVTVVLGSDFSGVPEAALPSTTSSPDKGAADPADPTDPAALCRP